MFQGLKQKAFYTMSAIISFLSTFKNNQLGKAAIAFFLSSLKTILQTCCEDISAFLVSFSQPNAIRRIPSLLNQITSQIQQSVRRTVSQFLWESDALCLLSNHPSGWQEPDECRGKWNTRFHSKVSWIQVESSPMYSITNKGKNRMSDTIQYA